MQSSPVYLFAGMPFVPCSPSLGAVASAGGLVVVGGLVTVLFSVGGLVGLREARHED